MIIFLFIFFFLPFSLFSDLEDPSDHARPTLDISRPLLISLGSHCELAAQLNHNSLRYAAYPLDWVTSVDMAKFIQLLENDFVFFLDEEYLKPYNQTAIIANEYYLIDFRHDSPQVDLWQDPERLRAHFDWMREKYERRIKRFYELGSYPGKVFFIRVAYDHSLSPIYWWQPEHKIITSNDSRALYNVLKRKFPLLNFKLVTVNYLEEEVPEMEEISGVISFKVRKTSRIEDYQKLFNLLLQE